MSNIFPKKFIQSTNSDGLIGQLLQNNPLKGKSTLYNFTLPNARRFYLSRGWGLSHNELKNHLNTLEILKISNLEIRHMRL